MSSPSKAQRSSCSQTQVYEPGSGISSTGALTAYSGKKTGRSPSDKRIVKEETSENEIWYGPGPRFSAVMTISSQAIHVLPIRSKILTFRRWGPVNKPMTPEVSYTQASLALLILPFVPP